MPYSFTRTAMCLEDYFLKGMPHTFERSTVYTCILIIICQYNIISELPYFKMMLYLFQMNAVSFWKEDCITPLFKLIFNEVIKYFLKEMPHLENVEWFMSRLPQGLPHSFKCWLMRSMMLPLKSDLILCFKICCPLREQHAYPYKTFHISLWCREFCQEDALLLGAKMKSPFNQRCCFLLFMLAIKTSSIEANTTLAFERGATGQNWVPFLFDIHGLNSIFHSKKGLYCSIFHHISTKLNFPSWLTGLLSGPCSLLLPDVQTWICTVYTQDLKPQDLPQ